MSCVTGQGGRGWNKNGVNVISQLRPLGSRFSSWGRVYLGGSLLELIGDARAQRKQLFELAERLGQSVGLRVSWGSGAGCWGGGGTGGRGGRWSRLVEQYVKVLCWSRRERRHARR